MLENEENNEEEEEEEPTEMISKISILVPMMIHLTTMISQPKISMVKKKPF
ncbi:MAG: hypothetical protein ACTSRX_09795 [Promethearchaeota archaeon]